MKTTLNVQKPENLSKIRCTFVLQEENNTAFPETFFF